jgi:hypothetical protein
VWGWGGRSPAWGGPPRPPRPPPPGEERYLSVMASIHQLVATESAGPEALNVSVTT